MKNIDVKKLSDGIYKAVDIIAREQLKNDWSETQPISLTIPSKLKGIYNIRHANKKIYYLGMGNINMRRHRHHRVFMNSGKALVSENGRSSDSPCANKMYSFDNDVENWYIDYLVLDENIHKKVKDAVMKRMEEILSENFHPEFCTEHMVGK